MIYPKLRAKYGAQVNYEDDPAAHLKTEFAFDVVQVAQGRYAPTAFHDFIGFKVSKPVLERAFLKTYSLELKEIFASLDLALGTYRSTVSTIIPEMTKVAWKSKKDELVKLTPGLTRDKFIYSLSRASYKKEWGSQYQKPGCLARIVSLLFRLVPKVGPCKALAFKPPPPEAVRLFMESFNASLASYRALLDQVRAGQSDLKNKNFDTGQSTQAGKYGLADKAYAKLLDKLAEHQYQRVTPELRENILTYYNNLKAPIETKKRRDEWQKTLRELSELKATQR